MASLRGLWSCRTHSCGVALTHPLCAGKPSSTGRAGEPDEPLDLSTLPIYHMPQPYATKKSKEFLVCHVSARLG